MNIHGLRLFHQVALTGSYTKAAALLHISQPAVSSQIKKFEQELGLPLFKQHGRGVALTEFGSMLKEKADSFFTLERHIEHFIDDYQTAKIGTIRVAATYLPANYLIPKWAAAFKQQHPAVNLVISTMNTSEAFAELQQYKTDIAIYGGHVVDQPEEVVAEDLFEDELWFVVSPLHPYAAQSVSLQTMMQEPFIMREEGSSMRAYLLSLCQTSGVNPPQIALQFNGLHETIQTVMAGYGASLVSAHIVQEYVQANRLARVYVEANPMTHKIAICTRKAEIPNALTQKFIAVCKRDYA